MTYPPSKPARLMGGLVLLASAASGMARADEKLDFDIPEQSLSQSLLDYSEAAGVNILVNENLARGIKAPGLSGRYTSEQGLNELLDGSGLNYRFTSPTAVIIESPGEQSLSTDLLLAKAPKENYPADPEPEAPYTGPVEQEDLMVRGGDWSGYDVLNATTGTKTEARLFDTPVSVQVVPKVVIDDQQAIGLGNVLQNVSGVARGWGFGANNNENIQIRGFNNSSIYRDGVLTPNSTNISLANVERVEVLKGPAGMLFGRTEPGGLVNVITKRPQPESYYSLQQQFGSYDTYRTLLDATGAIDQDGTLLYRLNYEHLDSDSFRDYVFDDRDYIAPSLTWHITHDTQLDLDFMYQNRETVSDSGIPYDLQLSGVIPGKIPHNFFGNEPTDFNNSEFYQGDVTLTHHFNEDWKVRGKFSMIRQDNATAQTSVGGNADLLGDLSRGFIKTSTDFESEYGTVDLTGHFSTWELEHTVLLGWDFYHSANANRFSPFRATGVPPINVFNPVYGFSDFLNDPLGPVNERKNEWYGFYVQDQIALSDQWQLLFGSRFDHAEFKFSGREKQVDEFSPRAGLFCTIRCPGWGSMSIMWKLSMPSTKARQLPVTCRTLKNPMNLNLA